MHTKTKHLDCVQSTIKVKNFFFKSFISRRRILKTKNSVCELYLLKNLPMEQVKYCLSRWWCVLRYFWLEARQIYLVRLSFCTRKKNGIAKSSCFTISLSSSQKLLSVFNVSSEVLNPSSLHKRAGCWLKLQHTPKTIACCKSCVPIMSPY